MMSFKSQRIIQQVERVEVVQSQTFSLYRREYCISIVMVVSNKGQLLALGATLSD